MLFTVRVVVGVVINLSMFGGVMVEANDDDEDDEDISVPPSP